MESNSYKWDAELYQKSSHVQFELGIMAIERLNPKDGEKILEIGSGNGLVTIELAKKIPNSEIIAVEISKEMVEQAKDNLAKYAISNVNLVNMDALQINYENEFDVFFSNSAIHWIQDIKRMYKLIHKALKKNGRILIQTSLKEISPIWMVLAKLVTQKAYRPYISKLKMPWRFFSIEKNQTILENTGYRNISIEPYEYLLKFSNKDAVFNYWKAAGLVPYLTVLPDELKEEFIEKFKRLYFSKMAETPLEYKMTRLFISAIK